MRSDAELLGDASQYILESDGLSSDQNLLQQAARGDEAAFLALYQKHQGSIFRFALHMSGSREAAEEVVQEVFLSLLSRPGGFVASSGQLQGYLIGSARNMIRNWLKQERRFVEMHPAASTGEQLLNDLSKQEDLRELRAAIAGLPLSYRETVVLCDMEGLDYAAAAEHLACPVGTVRSRLHRARSILAAKLRKRMGCAV